MGHQAKVSVRDLVYQPGGQSRGGDREGGVDPCNQIGIGEPFEAAHFRILGLQPGADGQGSWREVLVEEALEFQFPASRQHLGGQGGASVYAGQIGGKDAKFHGAPRSLVVRRAYSSIWPCWRSGTVKSTTS